MCYAIADDEEFVGVALCVLQTLRSMSLRLQGVVQWQQRYLDAALAQKHHKKRLSKLTKGQAAENEAEVEGDVERGEEDDDLDDDDGVHEDLRDFIVDEGVVERELAALPPQDDVEDDTLGLVRSRKAEAELKAKKDERADADIRLLKQSVEANISVSATSDYNRYF